MSKYLHKGESKSRDRTTLQFESCRGCSSCWFYLLTAGPKVNFKTITYKYLRVGFLSYSKTYHSNGLLNKEVHNYNSFHAWLSSILLPPDISLKYWPYCKLFVYTSDYVCALFQISMQTWLLKNLSKWANLVCFRNCYIIVLSWMLEQMACTSQLLRTLSCGWMALSSACFGFLLLGRISSRCQHIHIKGQHSCTNEACKPCWKEQLVHWVPSEIPEHNRKPGH